MIKSSLLMLRSPSYEHSLVQRGRTFVASQQPTDHRKHSNLNTSECLLWTSIASKIVKTTLNLSIGYCIPQPTGLLLLAFWNASDWCFLSSKNGTLCYFIISLLWQLRIARKFPEVHKRCCVLWIWNKCLWYISYSLL